ncbi:hypothetical protein DACRYDRAFT_104618 [Dacryopinax primogenitus]|uniref:Uncharacterized protein n=1 Tax=Dacryopinax primogenitus (strain DJM 731) TaxID=1858805 RepID=M5GG24_DACPD|nr:uncharacterized protein DACRYDRAFT_104618 [Dacryopinax primogenitus]EJU04743.1 hypothetical protein DACRYDRAFT_104618 [Dacryopinax primogenitus]
MLWELLVPVMGTKISTKWKRRHLGAPIGAANEDLPLEAWTEEDDNAGPTLPAITALEEEDAETTGALPGDSQETNQLASDSQKQVALVAKPLIAGTLPWGGIPASVLMPASTEVGPSATITEMEEEVVAHAKGVEMDAEQEEAKEAEAVEKAVMADVTEKKEDKPKRPKPCRAYQKTATALPPSNADEVEFVDGVPSGKATDMLVAFVPASADRPGSLTRGNMLESDTVEAVIPRRVMEKPITPVNTMSGKGLKNKGKVWLSAWNAPEPTTRLVKGHNLKAKPTTIAEGFQLLQMLYGTWWEVALLEDQCNLCAKEGMHCWSQGVTHCCMLCHQRLKECSLAPSTDKCKGCVVRKMKSLADVLGEDREWPEVTKPAKWEQVHVLLEQASSWLFMAGTPINKWAMEIHLNQAGLTFVLNTGQDEILYVHLPRKDNHAPMGMWYEMNLSGHQLISWSRDMTKPL